MKPENPEDPLRGDPGRGAKVAKLLRDFGISEQVVMEIATHPKMTLDVCKQEISRLDEAFDNPSGAAEALRSRVKYFNGLEMMRKDNIESMRAKPNPHLAAAEDRRRRQPTEYGARMLREYLDGQREMAAADKAARFAELEKRALERKAARLERMGIECEGCAGWSMHHQCGFRWDEDAGEYSKAEADALAGLAELRGKNGDA